jgi:type IV pilus assembly protein PilA
LAARRDDFGPDLPELRIGKTFWQAATALVHPHIISGFVKMFRAGRISATRINAHKGFSLIEMMIVIDIIGILAAIAIPQFSSYRQRDYNSTAEADLKTAYTATQACFIDMPD